VQQDYAAPTDLELSLEGHVAVDKLPERILTYCADMMRERVLFTCHDPEGLARVLSAAFMYAGQLHAAAQAISVPFERLDELKVTVAAPPVFIFSPGRTGSTLLARLLAAAGLACASEPDMLTQVARLPRDAFRLLPPDTRASLARCCIHNILTVLGGGTFVKLRSQCNARPLVLTEAAPGCRVVFMLRGVRAWAISRHKSFLEPPESVAAVLREAVDAWDKLAFSGVPFTHLWYEDLVADPGAALLACAPEASFDAAAIAAVMARDSQEDTPISRSLVAAMPAQEDFWTAFLTAWEEARAGAQWHPDTEGVLREMWGREDVLF
jgi:hypothetical protein